jgi:hypothetical protein
MNNLVTLSLLGALVAAEGVDFDYMQNGRNWAGTCAEGLE